MATLYDKIWDAHFICNRSDGASLIYIDRHLIHEVTSPQAFEGLERMGRRVQQPESIIAVCDHNVPTQNREEGIANEESSVQVETLEQNCKKYCIRYFGLDDKRQGIVHIVGPEQGFTWPGMTIVCGDSHTSTHGAFGALAFGIGTSEVEHVLATQTLHLSKAKNMRIHIEGVLGYGVSAKDLILAIIGMIGTAGATGHVIEYTGEVIRHLSMEARMTLCNMSIEAGARAGLIAPDEITFAYLKGRPMAPLTWNKAVSHWRELVADEDAVYEKEIRINASEIAPQVTWGTSPEMVLPISAWVPDPTQEANSVKKASMERALKYMALKPGTLLNQIKIDKVFIGSCTNGRIEDLREVAKIAQGKRVAKHVHAMIVPGSGLVKAQAQEEGLDIIFKDSGFDWREPGCSMCLAMNPDKLNPGERCASTSNRNFEGRQGQGGRTHLVNPAMAAAAAIAGHLVDVRTFGETHASI